MSMKYLRISNRRNGLRRVTVRIRTRQSYYAYGAGNAPHRAGRPIPNGAISLLRAIAPVARPSLVASPHSGFPRRMTSPTPLDAGTIGHAVEHGIATVTFAHPRGNSLPGALLRELAATFDALAPRDDVRVIVLRSAGTGPFCAGASFDELRSITDAPQGKLFFSGFAHVILAMRRCPQFVIARIHGKAVGGGVGLAAAADYSVATRAAAVRLSELAVGIGPFVVGPVIEHKIGRGHFTAMSVDYDWRDAAWAERTGLYARVAETVDEVDEIIEALAQKLATANPDAMRELKRVFVAGTEHWDTLLYERAAISGSLILTPPARKALAALARG